MTVTSVPRPPSIDLGGDDPDTPPPVPVRRRITRFAVTGIAAVFYLLGWVAGSILVPVIDLGRWVFAVISVGWDDAADSWRRNERIG
jgi:hypothetical protein